MLELIINNKSSKDFNLIITDWSKDFLPEIRDEYTEIEGVDGAQHQPRSLGNKRASITFSVIVKDDKEWSSLATRIRRWLFTRNETTIEFDDEPGIYYIGKVSSGGRPNFLKVAADFTIDLIYQPYGTSKTLTTESHEGNTASENDAFLFESNGSADSEFELSIIPQATINNLTISMNKVDLIINKTIAAGQTLKVVTDEFFVFLGIENITLDVDGEFPVVVPGENEIKLKASAPFSYTSQIEFRERYL